MVKFIDKKLFDFLKSHISECASDNQPPEKHKTVINQHVVNVTLDLSHRWYKNLSGDIIYDTGTIWPQIKDQTRFANAPEIYQEGAAKINKSDIIIGEQILDEKGKTKFFTEYKISEDITRKFAYLLEATGVINVNLITDAVDTPPNNYNDYRIKSANHFSKKLGGQEHLQHLNYYFINHINSLDYAALQKSFGTEKADKFIKNMSGLEPFVNSTSPIGTKEISKHLANSIFNNFGSNTSLPVRERSYAANAYEYKDIANPLKRYEKPLNRDITSVYNELGYLTNEQDRKLLTTEQGQWQIARMLYNGFREHLQSAYCLELPKNPLQHKINVPDSLRHYQSEIPINKNPQYHIDYINNSVNNGSTLKQ